MKTYKFDLTGEIIRIVTIESDSIVEFPDENISLTDNGTLPVTGIGIDLMDCLQLMLNFTISSYIFVESFFDERHGNDFNKGINSTLNTSVATYNETIFSLFQSNKSDLALGYLYFITSRLKVAQVLLPLSDEHFYLFFRQPKSSLDNPFTRQFSFDLSAAYLAILFLSAIILALYQTISSSLSQSIQTNVSNKWNSKFWNNLYDTITEAIGKWCQKSTGLVTSDKWQIKTVNNLLNYLSLILYIFYCAIILAALTKNVAPVREIRHLFQHQYTFFAFGDAKDRLSRGIGITKFWQPPPPIFPNKVEIDDDMQEYENKLSIYELGENRHAHLDTPDNFFPDLNYVLKFYFNGSNSLKSKQICGRLAALPVNGGGFQSGIYVRNGFKFRNEFNYGLAKIRETGINRRLLHAYENIRYQNIGCQFSIKRATYQDNLGMKYLGSLFIGLAVYCFIAVNILLAEFLLFKKNF